MDGKVNQMIAENTNARESCQCMLRAAGALTIILSLFIAACSSSNKSLQQPLPALLSTAENDARRQEQINRGLALFEGGHFADAAGWFEKAAALPGGQAPITRQCLMAAAVSRLVVNDRDGFTGNMIKIRNQYERSDFLLLTDSDVKLKHLMELYERITKGGKK